MTRFLDILYNYVTDSQSILTIINHADRDFNIQQTEQRMSQLKELLIGRLRKKGMEKSMIPGFLRSLSNSLDMNPDLSLFQANNRLRYMGWNDFELDYFTFQLAMECLEAYGMKKPGYKHPQRFQQVFLAY